MYEIAMGYNLFKVDHLIIHFIHGSVYNHRKEDNPHEGNRHIWGQSQSSFHCKYKYDGWSPPNRIHSCTCSKLDHMDSIPKHEFCHTQELSIQDMIYLYVCNHFDTSHINQLLRLQTGAVSFHSPVYKHFTTDDPTSMKPYVCTCMLLCSPE